jgi:hypothetical protein
MASNMPMTAPDPLSKLRDIHLPEPIGWWPLAPGWYLLVLLVIAILITIIFFLRRYYLNGSAKRDALRLLKIYQQQYQSEMNSQISSAHISLLLKRVALAYFPRARVASLQGDEWILFLNNTAKKLNFEEVRAELLEMPYQPQKDCDLGLLFEMAHTWIKQRRAPCLN